MAGTFGSVFGTRQAQHARKRHWSLFVSRGHRPARRLGITGAVIAACAAIAIAMLPLAATPASAQPPWTVTLPEWGRRFCLHRLRANRHIPHLEQPDRRLCLRKRRLGMRW